MSKILPILALILVLGGVLLEVVQAACTSEFSQHFLTRANEKRSRHTSPPMELNETISDSAQKWAEKQHSFGTETHSESADYGENIFYSSGNNMTETELADACIKTWYDNELEKYHWWGDEPNFTHKSEWTHLTQLIWKATNQTGVGCSTKGEETYVVVQFWVKGNIKGEFGDNVKSCTDGCN